MVGTVATGLGFVVRLLLSLLRVLPGIIGPLVVVYGVWLIYEPAGYIVGGVALWVFDVVTSRSAVAAVKESE